MRTSVLANSVLFQEGLTDPSWQRWEPQSALPNPAIGEARPKLVLQIQIPSLGTEKIPDEKDLLLLRHQELHVHADRHSGILNLPDKGPD